MSASTFSHCPSRSDSAGCPHLAENSTVATESPATQIINRTPPRVLVTTAQLQIHKKDHRQTEGRCTQGETYFHFRSAFPSGAAEAPFTNTDDQGVEVRDLEMDNTVRSFDPRSKAWVEHGLLHPASMGEFVHSLNSTTVSSANPEYLHRFKLDMAFVKLMTSKRESGRAGAFTSDGFLHETQGPVIFSNVDAVWSKTQQPERTWIRFKYPYTEAEMRLDDGNL